MSDLNLDGMALAPGVIETIISIATHEVDGVAAVGGASPGGLRSMFNSKPSTQGIDVEVNEDSKISVSIRIEVYYGYVLPDVAAAVRQSVIDATTSQVGIPVDRVDIFIDGIQFVD